MIDNSHDLLRTWRKRRKNDLANNSCFWKPWLCSVLCSWPELATWPQWKRKKGQQAVELQVLYKLVKNTVMEDADQLHHNWHVLECHWLHVCIVFALFLCNVRRQFQSKAFFKKSWIQLPSWCSWDRNFGSSKNLVTQQVCVVAFKDQFAEIPRKGQQMGCSQVWLCHWVEWQ